MDKLELAGKIQNAGETSNALAKLFALLGVVLTGMAAIFLLLIGGKKK